VQGEKKKIVTIGMKESIERRQRTWRSNTIRGELQIPL